MREGNNFVRVGIQKHIGTVEQDVVGKFGMLLVLIVVILKIILFNIWKIS